MKKNKFDKDNFGKKIDKKTCGETLQQEKIMWGGTVAIHNVFFFKKKTTKLNYQPTQYEKKLKLTKTILEKKKPHGETLQQSTMF